MPKVSIRLPDSEYEQLRIMRGSMTTSEYIRKLIAAQRAETRKEISDFARLFDDVSSIRQTLVTVVNDLPDHNALMAVAHYLKEVMSISNPPAYSNYADRLQELLQKLEGNLKG